jgi:hypothetical protein
VQDGGSKYRELYHGAVRLRSSEHIADYPIYDGTVLWIMPAPLTLAPSFQVHSNPVDTVGTLPFPSVADCLCSVL